MANKRRERLLEAFERAIHRFDYLEAMKIVGALNYSCAEEAREKEVQLLFLMKNYSKCVTVLEKENNLSQFENEVFVSSLAFTHQFDRVNDFLSNGTKIGQCCSALIQKYMQDCDYTIIKTYKVFPESGEFFEKIFLQDIVKELASIYVELENAKIMKSGGIDTSTIVANCLDRAKKVPIVDVFLDDIKKQIEERECFDSRLINAFIYIYLGKVNKGKSSVQVFKNVDDIVFYLDVYRKIDPRGAVLTTVCEYLKPILEEVQDGNKVIGDYLKELYVSSKVYEDLKINDIDTIGTIWNQELKRAFPALLENAKIEMCDNEIKSTLSDKAKIAYDAATWQYRVTIEEEYGIRDAGMLCLSYMRIVELELNNIFVQCLRGHGSELRAKFEEKKAQLRGNEKSEFINKWKICVDGFAVEHAEEENGFTLEKLWNLFVILSLHRDRKNYGVHSDDVNNEDELSIKCKEILQSVLNANGMSALENGRFVDMIEYDVRNKFRNPPAHTRYVSKETAFECKTYVENILLELYSYMC